MNEIDYNLAMQRDIEENSNIPTEDLIMNVSGSRGEFHAWAVAGFEKILESRNLQFNIYILKASLRKNSLKNSHN